MATVPSVNDTPLGFSDTQTAMTLDSAMIFDLKVSVANANRYRNVFASRTAARSNSLINQNTSFTLPVAVSGPVASATYAMPDTTAAFMLASNVPISIAAVINGNLCQLGKAALFVLSGAVQSVTVTNTDNAANAEITIHSI